MASTKSAPKKRPKKTKRIAKPAPAVNLRKCLLGVVLLLLIAGALAGIAHHLIGPMRTAVTPPVKKPASTPPPAANGGLFYGQVPNYEVYPERDTPLERPDDVKPPPPQRPRVAIIIDDLGYDRQLAARFATLEVVRTFSVLPSGPFRTQTMKTAADSGIELMLHLPMEPEEYPTVNPGPGALLMTQAPDELIGQLNRLLDELPLAVGVNNHMGSRLTADADRMNQVFSVLKRRGLFFIDSRTTTHTVCHQSARLLQLPFAQRDVFLDHDQDPAAVRHQVDRLLAVAKKHGEAIGIGHPHTVTFEALKDMSPAIRQVADVVPASSIVKIIPYT